MLYFSYGSFLDIDTLHKHCSGATALGPAALPNFEVQFNYPSTVYQAGVTGAEFAPGKVAYGVLYEVSPAELEYLDIIESVPEGDYYRQTVMVVRPDGELVLAETYRTSRPSGPYVSSRVYVGKMLKGAIEQGLPDHYVAELRRLYDSLPEKK
jgi:gamma-glutamylcyclotransferase